MIILTTPTIEPLIVQEMKKKDEISTSSKICNASLSGGMGVATTILTGGNLPLGFVGGALSSWLVSDVCSGSSKPWIEPEDVYAMGSGPAANKYTGSGTTCTYPISKCY